MNEEAQASPANKPAASTALIGLTKRQQLEKANKNIFLWVAAASVVVSLSIVALQFLVREALFNGKVIGRLSETNKTLEDNKKNFTALKSNVDGLLADDLLSSLRVDGDDSSLQVILDALPTSGDSTSFSNSLYNKILPRQGVNIVGATVGTGAALTQVPQAPATTATPVAVVSATPQVMAFGASFSGSPDQVRKTLMDIEQVIRPMSVKQISITAGAGRLDIGLQGETYYMPRTTIALGKATEKP